MSAPDSVGGVLQGHTKETVLWWAIVIVVAGAVAVATGDWRSLVLALPWLFIRPIRSRDSSGDRGTTAARVRDGLVWVVLLTLLGLTAWLFYARTARLP
jgi:hypothetical protein